MAFIKLFVNCCLPGIFIVYGNSAYWFRGQFGKHFFSSIDKYLSGVEEQPRQVGEPVV
jgi:hypothetical protein